MAFSSEEMEVPWLLLPVYRPELQRESCGTAYSERAMLPGALAEGCRNSPKRGTQAMKQLNVRKKYAETGPGVGVGRATIEKRPFQIPQP